MIPGAYIIPTAGRQQAINIKNDATGEQHILHPVETHLVQSLDVFVFCLTGRLRHVL